MEKEDEDRDEQDEASMDDEALDEAFQSGQQLETEFAEEEEESLQGETLIDKLHLLDPQRVPYNQIRKLDERSHAVREELRSKFKAAPKTLIEKAEEKKSRIERQLEASDRKLKELLDFGDELVTNIRVSNEKRELHRRRYETDRREELQNILNKESIESMAQFENITSRWEELDTYREPVIMHEKLQAQKDRIGKLMASKDDIIHQCEAEIARINDKYYSDQKKQAVDVMCMVERIDNQIELIKTAYNSHMRLLQQTIDDEWENITKNGASKWEQFYQIMSENETKKFAIAREKAKFYAEQLDRITRSQEEITRSTRIRLEKDAELLEWELRNVKNSVLMNSEKLDYNYQVLQKRNEENVVINNQQKRRVSKLNESILLLRKKIQESQTKSEQTMRKITTDIEKLHMSITDLEKKADKFRISNKLKFDRIWAINFKDICNSLEKVFDIDRILYEQQLILPWTRPEVDMEDINATDTESSNSDEPRRMNSVYSIRSFTGPRPKSQKPLFGNVTDEERRVQIRFMRNVMRKVADRGGFLVEEKLIRVLEPYHETEKCLVRIDNIFTALRIHDVKTIKTLSKFFRPYSYCPNCSNGLPPETLRRLFAIGDEMRSRNLTINRGTLMTQMTMSSASAHKATMMSTTSIVRSRPIGTNAQCSDHHLVIEPALVLTALHDFSMRQQYLRMRQSNTLSATSMYSSETNLIPFDNEVIRNFWHKFTDYVPEEKCKLWKLLQHGLNHYAEVLRQREQLDNECTFLRKQNRELKHLLQKFNV